jgi:hypothetical protein
MMEYNDDFKAIWEKAHERINVGDNVRVFNKEHRFETYHTFFKKNRIKNMSYRYAYGIKIDDTASYKVIAIGKWGSPKSIDIYVLEENKEHFVLDVPSVYLMSRAGIIKV